MIAHENLAMLGGVRGTNLLRHLFTEEQRAVLRCDPNATGLIRFKSNFFRLQNLSSTKAYYQDRKEDFRKPPKIRS